MQLKITTDYAIRIVLCLAEQGRVCPAQVIAECTGIDRTYIVQVAKNLRTSGLIQSVRGAQGGYELAKDPKDITLLDIVEPLEGVVTANCCLVSSRLCTNLVSQDEKTCPVHNVYCEIQTNLKSAFDIPLLTLLVPRTPQKGSDRILGQRSNEEVN